MAHLSLIDGVIPLRDEIVQRTSGIHAVQLHAGLTQRYAAAHAAGALTFPLLLSDLYMKFLKALDALCYRNHFIVNTIILKKTCYLTHLLLLSPDLTQT